MIPVIALVGRPNVGKSTLFNRLTRTRDALVADWPGLTRDRQYGFGKVGSARYVVVDTGGLGGNVDGLEGLVAQQTLRAVEEADAVVFIVDARDGLTAADQNVAAALRQTGRRIYLAVNKSEGIQMELAAAEFHGLGLAEPHPISSAHGDHVADLIELVLADVAPESEEVPDLDTGRIRVAVVGRPNVGKSTLINRLLGEERMVASELPGTTRDSIQIPFERDGREFVLIDTAGVRRRARVREAIEKFSVIKTLQAIDNAHVAIAVFDAADTIAEQDARLVGSALERGRALVVAVNKWDGLDSEQRKRIRREMDLRLPFLDFARIHFISALHGTGVGELMGSVVRAYRAATRELATPELTRALETAVAQHSPPLVHGRRIKLRYAHQGGRNPPVIVVHGNQTEHVPDAYRRYLVNFFRKTFDLSGTPIRVEFRTEHNPYAGRRRDRSSPRRRRSTRR